VREVNVHHFENGLTSTFRRYLFTKNLIADNEPDLRKAFWAQLQQKDCFTREPMLSAIPAYETSICIEDLVSNTSVPQLHPRLLDVDAGEIDVTRKLYTHQVMSLTRAQQGRNVIVATGTGSGKTECFLLPILDDILRNPGLGVRAIIVYPLNALANDQLDRLRALLRPLPEVTFGRYTGDTPWDWSNVSDEDRGDVLVPNERFTRQEIRDSPPHILLTNFAMLEYLLLRPGDNPIFKRRPLRYIVLDEAHTYSGAQGIEVSLLMRRLRECYRGSPLQFVLTSATLSDTRAGSRDEIAGFGAKLTGGDYSADDVLLGNLSNPFAGSKGTSVPLEDYISAVPSETEFGEWLTVLEDPTSLRTKLLNAPLHISPTDILADSVPRMLFRWMEHNREAAILHELCSERPHTVSELSEALWNRKDEDAQRVARWLSVLGANAVSGPKALPLLPIRFHLFYRGLGGATVCLSPACPGKEDHQSTFWSKFILEDRVQCPDCASTVLPLQTCVHCGMPAVAVTEDPPNCWRSVAATDTERTLILTWDTQVLEEDSGEDSGDELPRIAHLCVKCCAFSVDKPLGQCCQSPHNVALTVIGMAGDGHLQNCPRCGGSARPYPSVLQHFASGEDAPTAVLAESTIRNLPEEKTDKPASGRQILAFSDSRQRAAHFAPYLTQTTAETQFLKPVMDAIHQAVKSCPEGTTLNEVASLFLGACKKRSHVVLRRTDEEGEHGYEVKLSASLTLDDRKTLQRECLIALLQQFTASPRSRKTIPSLGLASVEVDLNEFQQEELKKSLPELFATGKDGHSIIQNLLSVVLYRKALSLPDGLSNRMIAQGPASATYHLSEQGDVAGRRRFRWNPYEAQLKLRKNAVRKSYISGLVAKHLGLDVQVDAATLNPLLTRIWDALKAHVLEQVHPSEYQIPYERLVIRVNREWYRCNRCSRLSVFPLGEACPSHDCKGSATRVSALDLKALFENHHWYHRLLQADPLCLVVKEHTAQLVNQRGRDYQREFREQRVNVLSSSTTFEMGVDVGQLKAVFLRNVPPTPANYLQRAGRAGRRRDGAAFAISFARSTPHDQFHFHAPLAIVQGKVPVPQINLANDRLTQRHVNSFLLSNYLLANPIADTGERLQVRHFFQEPSSTDSHANRYQKFLSSRAAELVPALRHIIPRECGLSAEDAITASCSALVGENSVALRLAQRLAAYEQQQDALSRQLNDATVSKATEKLGYLARAIKSTAALHKQLLDEALIDFLSSEHWLPSYAFPQDVVRLLVRQEKYTDRMRLERDGEIGLSEYAPGAEIIADGKLFKSQGIDLQHKELERRQYRVCHECRRVEFRDIGETVPKACPNCGAFPRGPLGVPRQFVRPPGFTTLFDDQVEEPNLYRLKPPPTSEVFLLQGAPEEAFRPHADFGDISYGYTQRGRLFRANPGRKYKCFRICMKCGRYFEKTPKTADHVAPWGSTCRGGYIVATDLAFQFDTDTLQLRFMGHPKTPPISDESFWLSLQTAFVGAAAEVLSIPLNDIAATYQNGPHGNAELVVYDRVPGGAGYVQRIVQDLRAIWESTLRRTRDCRNPLCDPQGSCYACLRSYSNQFKWDKLSRGPIATWTAELLGC
jgi:ATP-dependent helicase YprA (DUF1998 family)